VRVRGDQDKKVTGNFEVFIVETDTLIHSKQAGKGRATGAQAQQRIFKKIKAALDGIDPSYVETESSGRESYRSSGRGSHRSSRRRSDLSADASQM